MTVNESQELTFKSAEVDLKKDCSSSDLQLESKFADKPGNGFRKHRIHKELHRHTKYAVHANVVACTSRDLRLVCTRYKIIIIIRKRSAIII